jgi:hypothetical protein
MTYSLPEDVVPKLLPTTPLQEHTFPALFTQEATAVTPTLIHVTEARVVLPKLRTTAISERRIISSSMFLNKR